MTARKTPATPAKKAPAKRAPRKAVPKVATSIFVPSRYLDQAIAKVKPFASTDTTFPRNNGVVIEMRDGILTAFATDRFTLGCNEIEYSVDGEDKAPDFATIIRLADLPLVSVLLKRSLGMPIEITPADGRITLADTKVGEEVSPMDWRRSIASAVEKTSANPDVNAAVSMNPVYLRRFAQLKPRPAMRVSSALAPILVTSGDSFIGLLMPLREDGIPEEIARRIGAISAKEKGGAA
ncbi:hypothetical protein QSJ18_18370 [Gordonia sp. ABSL1-1]|uniref:hypothetical protein n=1 Tax=Gordonia sp. ABSL1-1 TaxID=3053923 RepID=UPI0025725224|nr:hypothetical protein [Gordonia sp. ABSL1-1]MDL9938716.1 hypothetical protein [Gordonia sp. ABSL1-1]